MPSKWTGHHLVPLLALNHRFSNLTAPLTSFCCASVLGAFATRRMMASRCAGAFMCALLIAACSAQDDPIVLRNANGMEVHLLRTGACVQRLLVPTGDGSAVDVMMGFDDPESYRVSLLGRESVGRCLHANPTSF